MKKVLIIDDDPVSNFVTKLILKGSNKADVINECFDGQEGIDFIKKHYSQPDVENIDFILLDLNMPILDGWQFLEEYNKMDLHSKAKIYILSSSNYDEDIAKSKEYPIVQDYLVKPLRKDTINEILEN